MDSQRISRPEKSSKIEIDVAYVEVAYLLTEHWQIASRYEVAEFGVSAPEFHELQHLPKNIKICASDSIIG